MSEEMKRYTLTLEDVQKVGEDYFIFSFYKPKDLIYKEGQYGIFMHVDKDITGRKVRAFSFASGTKELLFKIGTKITDEPSDFKAKMRDLNIGDTMTVDGPMGSFILDEEYHSVFLAAGIGITPMRSIIKQLELLKPSKETILVYAEHRGFYPFNRDFNRMDFLKLKYESTGDDMKQTAKELGLKYLDSACYYVAGNPNYVSAITQILQESGVSKPQIKLDKFNGY